MKISYRLTVMFISIIIILVIGRWSIGSFDFATGQFWFVSGALLLILLSLVDQPHFSKDANVFVNGATALVSLFTVSESQRFGLWWIFFCWATYLLVLSFVLMTIRSRALFLETPTVRFLSRLNRIIGRPESIFSAFFLGGIFLQFSYPKDGAAINSLLLFWAVFMILNVPGIAHAVSSFFLQRSDTVAIEGVVSGIQSPRLAEVKLRSNLSEGIIGKTIVLKLADGEKVAEGILFDDRIVQGLRQGRVALTQFGSKWGEVSAGGRVELGFLDTPVSSSPPVSVVGVGSSIGRLVFEVDPRTSLHSGEVVQVAIDQSHAYYQIVAATIGEVALAEGNSLQNVRVVAGQLGSWNETKATFTPIDWVPPAGELVAVTRGGAYTGAMPAGRCTVGHVPNSHFPVHVDISDAITHNTALIGVTGSGKSYLAFHLIEAYLAAGIKVLILDITRQHWHYLQRHNPTALTSPEGVAEWLAGASNLAIYQFANATAGFPKATAEFAEKCFETLQNSTRLRAGVDIPARLCIVFEEAHSLIPEWNQVAQSSDTQQVNRTARVILQGRKFGLGTMLITQRTANVTKTILNQCNTVFALRSFDQTGLDFLRNYMGEEYSQAISTLPHLTAILVGKASSSSSPIIFNVSNFQDRWQDPQQLAVPGDVPVIDQQ